MFVMPRIWGRQVGEWVQGAREHEDTVVLLIFILSGRRKGCRGNSARASGPERVAQERPGASIQPATLAMEGKGGQRAWLIVEEHLQMLDGGEERIVMGRKPRWRPDGVKPGAQPVEMQAHAAQQGVKGLNRKWPASLLGTGIDGLIGGLTEQRQDGPELRGGGGMPGDGGIEINGERAAAASAPAAIGTEDSLSAQHESGGIGITEPVEEGMQDEKADRQTVGTAGGAEGKKGLRSLSRSETKRGTTMERTNGGIRSGKRAATAKPDGGTRVSGESALRGRTARLSRHRLHRVSVVIMAQRGGNKTARKRRNLRQDRCGEQHHEPAAGKAE